MQHGIDYKAGQFRLYVGEELKTVPLFVIDDDGAEVRIIVLALDDLRVPVRTTADGKAIERARTPAVEALITED
jgi:hypothetical protein